MYDTVSVTIFPHSDKIKQQKTEDLIIIPGISEKSSRHINYINEKIAGYLLKLDETEQVEAVDQKPDAREII